MTQKQTDDERLSPEADATGSETGADIPVDADTSGDGDAAAAADESAEQDPLTAALAESEANRDRWMRAQAELDNYRKRVQKERAADLRYSALPLLRDLLPGLDNLHRAIEAIPSDEANQQLAQGLEMVTRQFEEIFARHGAEPITALGEPFDPNLHEALQQIPTSEHPPMTVIQEVERGYRLHDRVIRPTKVIVSAELPAPADESTD